MTTKPPVPMLFASPGRYIQGPDLLSQCGRYVAPLVCGRSDEVVVLIPALLRHSLQLGPRIERALQQHKIKYSFVEFQGECSQQEIDRILSVLGTRQVVVMGVGGGKCLDTAKAVAFARDLPCVIVPTQASTDAPTSASSVVYKPSGDFERYVYHKANPNIVLVDSTVCAQAPLRFMLAGVGDAMSTFYEARACERSGALNVLGGRQTRTALALAALCRDALFQFAPQCVLDMKLRPGQVTEAVERIIEANTLLSGLGFESAGLAAAHALHNGLTVMPETHKHLHGEKVAFTTIVLLVLEQDVEEAVRVATLFKKIGLAYRLSDLSIQMKSKEDESLRKACELACVPGETMHNEPFKVNPRMVYRAVLRADAIGRALDSASGVGNSKL